MNPTSREPPKTSGEGAKRSPISCEAIQRLLVDYLTRELGENRSDLVREHLRRCPVCQTAAAELASTLALLKEASQDGPPIPDRLSPRHRERMRWAMTHPIRDWLHRHHGAVSLLITILTLLALLLTLRRCGVWKRDEPDLLPPVQIAPQPGQPREG